MSHHIDCTSCGGTGFDSFKTDEGVPVIYTGLSGTADKCGTCLGMKVIPGPVQMVDNVTGPIARIVDSLKVQESPDINPHWPDAVQAFLQECAAGVFDHDADDVENAEYSDVDNGYTVEIAGEDWLVMSDWQVGEAAAEQVWELAWAFRPEFLECHIPSGCVDAVKALQENSESGLDGIQALILAGSGKDHFIDDAIAADGRGYFLAPYDDEEHEIEWRGDRSAFFAYRQN